MSAKEGEFVPVNPKREKKEKKAKQPAQEKKPAQEKPKEAKEEKPAEQKSLINEHTLICLNCYQIGHKSEACPEKKAQSDVYYCSRCGRAGHRAADCKQSMEKECFYCGQNTHTYSQCPEREKVLFEVDGRKKESSQICRNCGCVGHTVRECKLPDQRRHICFRCGEEGHSSNKCEKPAEDHSQYLLCRFCGEIGHSTSDCKAPKVQRPDVCPICGQIGHKKEECTLDMPEEVTKVVEEKKPEPVKAPKKTMTSSDLQDTEQFPSL